MGEGGTLPTVTDANLVLGYLNPSLLGGRLPLDLDKARMAIKTIADPLGLSVEPAAYGMFTIVNSNMVNGIRRVSVERGYDPRDFVLVGAGGATAAHITFSPAIWASRRNPSEAGVRTLRVRTNHIRREIQLHGDESVAP